MITGSILKTDNEWGKPWKEISKPMKVYAITDVNHGCIVWDVLVG